jgi:inosine-uridine nucleoside N-ribohydrolase
MYSPTVSPQNTPSPGARPLLIDTDPGVDDAMAILMALASPELDVLGLTTIFGNAATEVTTRNAFSLLETAGRTDIPVAVGRSDPIAADYLGPVPQVHGTDGLGDANLFAPSGSPVEADAASFIHQTVSARPNEVTVMTLGPVTNLADAITRFPDLVHLVDQVVVMGGNALVPGNATPTAEANINNDPEAADLVFGADWDITMVGLDVTQQVNMFGAAIDRIAAHPSPTGALLAKAVPLYRNFFETTNGIDGIYLHDPSTVAYLLDPDAFTTNQWPIRVETEGFSRGKTWPNLGDTDDASPPAWRDRPLVNVCTGVDAVQVAGLVEERLTR